MRRYKKARKMAAILASVPRGIRITVHREYGIHGEVGDG